MCPVFNCAIVYYYILMSSEIKSMKFNAGSTVIVGDSVNHGYFYIVKSGTLAITSGSQYGDKELSRFESGDTFGLVSALTTGKHLATIKARTQVELIGIPTISLGHYLRAHKEVCLKMLSFYSRELKALDRHLVNLNEQTPLDNGPEKLFLDAKIYRNLNLKDLASHALAHFIKWVEEHPESPGQQFLTQARELIKGSKYDFFSPEGSEKYLHYKPNSIIFLENEPGNAAYVIIKGAVKLFKLVKGKEFVIAVLGPGEIFGEQSLLEDKPYSASAICREPVELLRLKKDGFIEDAEEKILQKMFESLARRIWFSHKRLAILRIPDPGARLYFYLLSLCRTQKPHRIQAEGDSYIFPFSVSDLCKMCGLLKVKNESISDFLEDKNISISSNRIEIHNVIKLEACVHGHRRRTLSSKSYV